MKKTSRIVSLCLAVMFIVSCMVIPASAADNGWHFTTSLCGLERPVYWRVVNENGNPIPTVRSLPFDKATNIPMSAGYSVQIWDNSNVPFYLPARTNVTLKATLDSSGKVELGYAEIIGQSIGTPNYTYSATTAKTSHEGNMTIPTSGSYIFYIHNNSGYSITVTNLSAD